MDLGLKGRSCVVTGAGRGIGRASARMLCEAGAQVLLVSRTSDELREAAAESGRAERIIAEAEDRFGAVDVVVNNAGSARWRDLDDVPEQDWYDAWELNVMAPMRLMRAAVPSMAERGWGRIVNVSSTAGKRPSPMLGEYSVAKAAQLSLSRLFADRHAASGVLINAICPGPIKSEMWMREGGLLDQSRAAGQEREAALAEAGSGRPIGRLGEVDEVAAAIAFLCSERSSYAAGAAWSVDGGTVQVII